MLKSDNGSGDGSSTIALPYVNAALHADQVPFEQLGSQNHQDEVVGGAVGNCQIVQTIDRSASDLARVLKSKTRSVAHEIVAILSTDAGRKLLRTGGVDEDGARRACSEYIAEQGTGSAGTDPLPDERVKNIRQRATQRARSREDRELQVVGAEDYCAGLFGLAEEDAVTRSLLQGVRPLSPTEAAVRDAERNILGRVEALKEAHIRRGGGVVMKTALAFALVGVLAAGVWYANSVGRETPTTLGWLK